MRSLTNNYVILESEQLTGIMALIGKLSKKVFTPHQSLANHSKIFIERNMQ